MKERSTLPYAHGGNRLSGLHDHAFYNPDTLVECIGAQILRAVTDDDKASIARESTPHVDHTPGMRSNDGLTSCPLDGNPIAIKPLTGKTANNLSGGRPDPRAPVPMMGQGSWQDCDLLRVGRGQARGAGARDPYPFPRIDEIRGCDLVPGGQFTVIQSITPSNRVERITLPDRIQASLRGLWPVEDMRATGEQDAARNGPSRHAQDRLHG